MCQKELCMDLRVNALSVVNNYNYTNKKQNLQSFHGKTMKTLRNAGLALFASGLFMMTSCNHGKTQNINENNAANTEKTIVDTKSKVIDTDTGSVMMTELIFNDSTYSRTYFNTSHDIILQEYNDRNKTEHRIEYLRNGDKIYETTKPNGSKIVTEKQKGGKVITTEVYPNKEKLVTEEWNEGKLRVYQKTKFFDNGVTNERYVKKNLQSAPRNKKTVYKMYELYNKKGIMLGWIENSVYEPDSTTEQHDDLGRLVYNKETNTMYTYKGNDTVPSTIISIRKSCRHKIDFEDGKKKTDYYKAANGNVITAEKLMQTDFID